MSELRESRVGNPDTNPVKEPVTEPCVGGVAAHSLAGFEDFWGAHPRLRDRSRAEKLFSDAVVSGIDAGAIIRAAERYRAENSGNKPQYVAYADNWLEQRRWEDYREAPQIIARSTTVRDAAAFWAAKVKAGKYIPPNAFGAEIAACMIRSGLLQQQDLLRAGVRV